MNTFKGVWIPEQLIDLNITWTKRILLAEISQLETLDKGCIASNEHFATKLRITKQGISKALNELAKDGYILIDNAQTKRNYGRKITINYRKSAINCGLQSKENKTINAPKETLEAFESLWKDYTLTFLKLKNRGGGSKAKALKGYLSLVQKYSYSQIYDFVEDHAGLEIGHKDLERLLRLENMEQYYEDRA